MKRTQLTTSRLGATLLRSMCKWFPRRWLYKWGDWLCEIFVSNDKRSEIQATRANLSVVLELPQNHTRVDKAMRQVFRNTARGYIDLFYSFSRGPAQIFDSVQFDGGLEEIVQEHKRSGKGLLLVGTHTCSFDLLLLALKKHFPSIQALVQSNPDGNSLVMNDIRDKFGLDVTPISAQSLKAALKRLRAGGVVAVAADMPMGDANDLMFFGRKSRLPSAYTRLAIKTDSLICVGASHKLEDGRYQATGTLVPRPTRRQADEISWAQEALFQIETLIREKPDEWIMPFPVWEDQPKPGVSTLTSSHNLLRTTQA